MKLKQAMWIARNTYDYIAVDKSNLIYGYVGSKPEKQSKFWVGAANSVSIIGRYTGSKHWTKTLRNV